MQLLRGLSVKHESAGASCVSKVHPMRSFKAAKKALGSRIDEALVTPEMEPCMSLTHDPQAQAEALETLNRWQARKGPLVSSATALAHREKARLTLSRRQLKGNPPPLRVEV